MKIESAHRAYEPAEITRIEKTRLAEEKANNVLRLIDYNNKRIARGLRPVDYPEATNGNESRF